MGEGAVRGALRAVRGRKSSLQFFQNLNQVNAQGQAQLNEALRRGALNAKHAGVAVVLSDFLDPAGYQPGLTALIGRGFQVSAVQILAPEEVNPTSYGDLRLVFEGLSERRRLMSTAPHLCRPVEFIFPGYRGERPSLFTEGVGISLYNALALWRPPASSRRRRFWQFWRR